VAQGGKECPEVVRNEKGTDCDRQDVVEGEAPAGDEGDDLVEGVTGKGGGAAGLRKHCRPLGIGLCGEGEEPPSKHEDHGCEAERVSGNQAERVVDRGADVAIGSRKQARHPNRFAQPSCL
jgi:hypothetical protein